jgi:Na+-transporting NADH:ubiquinone oxidoreductase subunit B
MKIREILDNLKKPFDKGQKLEKFYPAFDAFETFLFVPNLSSKTGSHIRDAMD